MSNEYAIMDKKGLIVDGSYEEIMAIWQNPDYDYGTGIEGDLILVKILGYKR